MNSPSSQATRTPISRATMPKFQKLSHLDLIQIHSANDGRKSNGIGKLQRRSVHAHAENRESLFHLDSLGSDELEEKLHQQKPSQRQQERGRRAVGFAALYFSNNGSIGIVPVFLWYHLPHISFQLFTFVLWHAVLCDELFRLAFQLQSETTVQFRAVFFSGSTGFSKRALLTLNGESCSQEHREAEESEKSLHGSRETEYSV